jgi:hypothetical protein
MLHLFISLMKRLEHVVGINIFLSLMTVYCVEGTMLLELLVCIFIWWTCSDKQSYVIFVRLVTSCRLYLMLSHIFPGRTSVLEPLFGDVKIRRIPRWSGCRQHCTYSKRCDIVGVFLYYKCYLIIRACSPSVN